MLAGSEENPPQIHQSRSIQPQCVHGRSTARRKADDERTVLVPGKMIAPELVPGMEQRHGFAADGVARPGLCVFVIVAEVADMMPPFVTGIDPGFL